MNSSVTKDLTLKMSEFIGGVIGNSNISKYDKFIIVDDLNYKTESDYAFFKMVFSSDKGKNTIDIISDDKRLLDIINRNTKDSKYHYKTRKKIDEKQMINCRKITRFPKEERWKLDKDFRDDLIRNIFLDPISFSTEQALAYVDYIAYQISKYAKSDIGRVILLNKFITENIMFDWECCNETKRREKLREQNKVVPASRDFNGHVPEIMYAHYLPSIFKNKKAVCSAISKFAELILNHPLINIECEYISDNPIKGHAWNNVKIDGLWYTCDFTMAIEYPYNDPQKYMLIASRSKVSSSGEICSDRDYPRGSIYYAATILSNVNVKMPEPEQSKQFVKATGN